MKIFGKKIMMLGMVLLLSCFAVMVNSNTANAMTLKDLQGTYRVVGADTVYGYYLKGGLIEITSTGDSVVGKMKNSVGGDWGLKTGDEVIYDVWVDEGVVHCKANYSYVSKGWDSTITPYNNGNFLKIVQDENDHILFLELKKVS